MKIFKNGLKSQKKPWDFILFGASLLLTFFGLLMVYDVSALEGLRDSKDSYYYIRQQIFWAILGFGLMLFFANFDYKKFKKISAFLFFTSAALLLVVLIPGFGVSGGGAHRWLKIGFLTIQPAEIIKLTGVLFLATVFEKKIRANIFLGIVVFAGFVIAVLQKDLGSALVFTFTVSILYLYAGAPLWHFLLSLPLAGSALWVLIFTSSYRSKRILAFMDPFSDPQGYTYHISQILIALGSGGFFGLGFGKSRQKLDYIPEVSTDSIFAIVGEELGFLGAVILILLFGLLIYRGFKIVQNCSDNFGKLLAVGLTSWLGVQIIINLSSMVALLPLTGVPLPFISYGGSALLTNLTGIGILLNISRQDL